MRTIHSRTLTNSFNFIHQQENDISVLVFVYTPKEFFPNGAIIHQTEHQTKKKKEEKKRRERLITNGRKEMSRPMSTIFSVSAVDGRRSHWAQYSTVYTVV
jgi:hypothetical protein